MLGLDSAPVLSNQVKDHPHVASGAPPNPKLRNHPWNAPVRKAYNARHLGGNPFQHSFASHLLEDAYDIRPLQELLGPEDVKAIITCTYTLERVGRRVRNPMDALFAREDQEDSWGAHFIQS